MNTLLQILENYQLHGETQARLYGPTDVDCIRWRGFVNGVLVCIDELKRVQQWEQVLGVYREDVVRLLGEPDSISKNTSRKYRVPNIYKYGDIELHFQPWKHGFCIMVLDGKEQQVVCKK